MLNNNAFLINSSSTFSFFIASIRLLTSSSVSKIISPSSTLAILFTNLIFFNSHFKYFPLNTLLICLYNFLHLKK
nr:hypothetical protein [Sulfolobus sp. NOB8H2]